PAQGGCREALALLDGAAALRRPTQAYHRRRSVYLEQLGDRAAAGRERDLAAADRPAGAIDYFLLGDERYRGGDLAGAIDAFRAASDAQPHHFWAQCCLAGCAVKAQRWDVAQAAIASCL